MICVTSLHKISFIEIFASPGITWKLYWNNNTVSVTTTINAGTDTSNNDRICYNCSSMINKMFICYKYIIIIYNYLNFNVLL